MSNLNFLNYRTIELLGEGGMGKVYLAEDTMLEKKVALKVLNAELSRETLFIERFKQEAKIQSKLLHHNIITLHNLLKDNNTFFIVMEYGEGITLKELITKTGPINESRALKIFEQILEAVGYAHSRNVIHRDLKPSNVMISYNDEVKIMDFGIAKLLGERGLTSTGSKVGTLYYMSPEQIERPKEVDYKADLYSMGIILFEMLTGQLPYNIDTDSDFKLMNEIVNNPLPDPRQFYPHISDKSLEIIRTLTQKDKNLRFANSAQCVNFIKYGKVFDDSKVSSAGQEKTIISSPASDKTELTSGKKFQEPVNKAVPPPPPQMTASPKSMDDVIPPKPMENVTPPKQMETATPKPKENVPPTKMENVIPPKPMSDYAVPKAMENVSRMPMENVEPPKPMSDYVPPKPMVDIPQSSSIKSNIPVAPKTNKLTGLFIAAGIIFVLLLAAAFVKFVILDKDESPKIEAGEKTVTAKTLDSNKVKELMDEYLTELYGENNSTDSLIKKDNTFNFIKPANEKFESQKYNPFSGSYEKKSLDYSGFILKLFSDNIFIGQYNLTNIDWEIVADISGEIINGVILIKEVKYGSLSFVGKEEEVTPPVKTNTKTTNTKITNTKPPTNNNKPPTNNNKPPTNTTTRPPH